MPKAQLRSAANGARNSAIHNSNEFAASRHSARSRARSDDTRVTVELVTSAAGAARLLAALKRGNNRFVLTESVGAVSIRASVGVANPESSAMRSSRFADAWIDWETGSLERRRHRTMLSRTERRLLACLLEHEGTPVTHRQLIAAGWPRQKVGVSQNLLGVYIHYLRRRLASVGLTGVIQTVRRVGYRITPRPGAASAIY
jgi:DNA-binding response OmpR family regulator